MMIFGITLTVTLLLLVAVRLRNRSSRADLGSMGDQWVAANQASRTSASN
jgi:hypothetical protein